MRIEVHVDEGIAMVPPFFYLVPPECRAPLVSDVRFELVEFLKEEPGFPSEVAAEDIRLESLEGVVYSLRCSAAVFQSGCGQDAQVKLASADTPFGVVGVSPSACIEVDEMLLVDSDCSDFEHGWDSDETVKVSYGGQRDFPCQVCLREPEKCRLAGGIDEDSRCPCERARIFKDKAEVGALSSADVTYFAMNNTGGGCGEFCAQELLDGTFDGSVLDPETLENALQYWSYHDVAVDRNFLLQAAWHDGTLTQSQEEELAELVGGSLAELVDPETISTFGKARRRERRLGKRAQQLQRR